MRSFNWYYEYRQIVFKLVAQALLDDHAQGPLPDGVRLYLVETVDACFFSDDLASHSNGVSANSRSCSDQCETNFAECVHSTRMACADRRYARNLVFC